MRKVYSLFKANAVKEEVAEEDCTERPSVKWGVQVYEAHEVK
jgi:hypothetical protein